MRPHDTCASLSSVMDFGMTRMGLPMTPITAIAAKARSAVRGSVATRWYAANVTSTMMRDWLLVMTKFAISIMEPLHATASSASRSRDTLSNTTGARPVSFTVLMPSSSSPISATRSSLFFNVALLASRVRPATYVSSGMTAGSTTAATRPAQPSRCSSRETDTTTRRGQAHKLWAKTTNSRRDAASLDWTFVNSPNEREGWRRWRRR